MPVTLLAQAKVQSSDAEAAACLDERLCGLEKAVYEVRGGVRTAAASAESTQQRITAAEWRIDKVCSPPVPAGNT